MATQYRIQGSARHDPACTYSTNATANPVRTLAELLAGKHIVDQTQIVIAAWEVTPA
jgi:hypothetical protein